ncbi:AraC family transcriptional regulator [Maribacter sp. TH_r10]|uniref:helix-turn-helix domain-containing protein n=1 Tax=Maribacter sp. TH_r10 TaxID=3082086 RepID=UPI002953C4B3|nr:AraC family transcriptional regulator [Maribacter sp. TH_r10]MDV7139450.1 AraC family transcriptional regulator [Maribacter sp. TH_r10]
MELRLIKEGDKQYLHKNIKGEKLFRNVHIRNSVRFETIEIDLKEGEATVNGTAFSNKVRPDGKNLEMCVSSNCPVLKLHFSLQGGYRHEPLNNEGLSIHIPESHCNMYYVPSLKGKDVFSDEKTKIFEIYVAHDSIDHLLYGEFKERISELHDAIDQLKTYVLWEKSKPISANILSKINEIIKCPYTNKVRKCYLESKLTALLIDFLLGKNPSKAMESELDIPKADYQALEKVEVFITKNLKKPLNILDLARIAGFNATKLKRDFKKVYGMPVFKYITTLRMEAAKKMIIEEELPIAHAAYEVGYANPQHFTAAFKRTMGYLPSALKRGN